MRQKRGITGCCAHPLLSLSDYTHTCKTCVCVCLLPGENRRKKLNTRNALIKLNRGAHSASRAGGVAAKGLATSVQRLKAFD